MSTTPDRERITLSRDTLRGLFHIVDAASSNRANARAAGRVATFHVERALATLHDEPQRSELLDHLDELERRERSCAPPEAWIHCVRCGWESPASEAPPVGECPCCTDRQIRTGRAEPRP